VALAQKRVSRLSLAPAPSGEEQVA
jgi:hypothetical protein